MARTFPARAVEAIGSFLGCSLRKERRGRSEPTGAGKKSFVLSSLSMVLTFLIPLLKGPIVRAPRRHNTERVLFLCYDFACTFLKVFNPRYVSTVAFKPLPKFLQKFIKCMFLQMFGSYNWRARLRPEHFHDNHFHMAAFSMHMLLEDREAFSALAGIVHHSTSTPPALVIGETCRHGKTQYDSVQQDKLFDVGRVSILATQQLAIET